VGQISCIVWVKSEYNLLQIEIAYQQQIHVSHYSPYQSFELLVGILRGLKNKGKDIAIDIP
jgi:hypothetical protein